MRMIAQQTGISVGILYHYFTNKEQPCPALMEKCLYIGRPARTADIEKPSRPLLPTRK
ncbi:MAG: regulatory protein [Syntrophorhabdus sp. PtaU1.Bin002]|nr:MAG: regulatory protein [Syntrophorhabdus sp. PtaU1.Bin002]